MRLASYKTERGALRYAAEIMRKFPSVKAVTCPLRDFSYGVRVTTSNGETAMAGKRPRHYGNALDYSTFRIPNDKSL